MKSRILLITIISAALCSPAIAQSPKGAEQLKAKPVQAPKPASNIDGEFSVLRSHIKSLGTIGKTSRYEIVSARLRGLDTPSISALIAYDSETDTLAVLSSGTEPGLGVAIVNGGAQVGGSFLFGSKLRPDRTSVSNNSESEGSSAKSVSEGGEATSVSLAEGGDADARSSSSASSKNHNKVTSQNTNVNQQSQSNSNSNTNSRKNGNGPKDKN